MLKEKIKQITNTKQFHMCMVLVIIVAIIFVAGVISLRYNVEGEETPPFTISKVSIISSVDGTDVEGSEEKWNLKVNQNNDIYLYIDKDEEHNNGEILTKVLIDNIQIEKNPQKGTIRPYMPNSSEGRLYDYSDEYLVNNSLEYTGAAKSNPKTLEIGSQGGTAYIRFSNTKIGNYTSNKDKEIVHNGTLLNKIGATNEEIKFNVSFDLTIQTDKNKYKTSISNIEMPSGNLIEEGTTQFEKTDMSDLIFKRVN